MTTKKSNNITGTELVDSSATVDTQKETEGEFKDNHEELAI